MEQEVEWQWGKVQEKVRCLEAKGKKVEVTVSEQKADQTLQIHPPHELASVSLQSHLDRL